MTWRRLSTKAMMLPLATVLTLLTLATPALAADRLPSPPSADPKQYKAWRAKLPKAAQQKVEQHCRDHGGDYRPVCNGIGPLAVPPHPPVDVHSNDEARRDWLDSSSQPHRHYVAEYCAVDRSDPNSLSRGFSTLCGGTPVMLTKLARNGLALLVSGAAGDPLFDPLLVSAIANSDSSSMFEGPAKKILELLFRDVERLGPAPTIP